MVTNGVSSPESRFAACPATPNCVGSRESGRKYVAPFVFSDRPDAAFSRLKRVLSAMPRVRLVESTDSYLHAEAASRIFGFVDDIEFLLDAAANRIEVRSAARAGYSDFGVNRRRVEAIRARFAAQQD